MRWSKILRSNYQNSSADEPGIKEVSGITTGAMEASSNNLTGPQSEGVSSPRPYLKAGTESPHLVVDYKMFEDRVFKTYKTRLEAYKRLKLRYEVWNGCLVSTTAAAVVASVAILSAPDIFGPSGALLLVSISIVTLVVSLITSVQDYSGRSRDMFLNYRKFQRLAVEIEILRSVAQTINPTSYEKISNSYQDILDESENHTQGDFQKVESRKREDKKWRRSVIADNLITIVPLLGLIIPAILICRVCWWIFAGAE